MPLQGKEMESDLLEGLFEPAADVITKDVDNVMMVVNAHDGNCYELNETGRLVWKALANGEAAGSTVGALAAGGVAEDRVRADVAGLVGELVKAKLLRRRGCRVSA